MAVRKYPTIDIEDYFMLDQNSTHARYEYLDGELRMLAGGSIYHSAIIARLIGIFQRRLEDSSCWVHSSDLKLQLSESCYVYPDIMISCDPRDQQPNQTVLRYPSLIVEVLSPSTEAVDRGEKLLYYQNYPTIQDYLIVDSQSISIAAYHRAADGWQLHIAGANDTVRIERFNLEFTVISIYRGMELPEKPHKRGQKG